MGGSRTEPSPRARCYLALNMRIAHQVSIRQAIASSSLNHLIKPRVASNSIMFDRETAQSLLAQLPVPTSGNKLSSDSEDAKAFARAASKILEYYHLHPVDTAALIPVQEMGQIRMADLQDGGRATAIVIAPLSSKAAAKRPRTDPGHSVLMKGSHAGKAVAQFAFGGRGALVDVGDGGHVLVLRGKGKLQVDGKTQQAADPSIRGYCYSRVNPKSGTAGSSGNEKTGNADKLDHFSLYHAVLAPNSEAEPPSAAPDPATLPAGLASGPLGSLEVGHPFASALRETNVAVVEKMVSAPHFAIRIRTTFSRNPLAQPSRATLSRNPLMHPPPRCAAAAR